jgi:hypothetical protein
METLNALFRKVDVASLLQPMGVRQIKHRVSLYAYDLIIFISPVASDLSLVNGIFQAFREAWGLRCNFNKCQITPIRCDDAQISLTIEFFPCAVVEFPIRYLGIPLSTTKLLKSSWHSLIDKVADKLPVWKGNLMHKSRRLTLIKTTLSAVPIHSAISLEFPAWVLKALIKLMREFLWMGMEVVPGGRCSVTWSQVQHPLASNCCLVQKMQRPLHSFLPQFVARWATVWQLFFGPILGWRGKALPSELLNSWRL